MDGKINSIDKEIWYKKILNFCNRNITVVYISVGVLIILGYIFFFSSPYFIGGVDEDNLKFTAIGTISKDGLGKEFTLENWEYCDAEDKMIVEISIENLVFDNKAAQQRQRRMKGIFEIASKAVLAHTEFFPIGDDNEWYRTLYNGTMIQLEAMAQQTGKSVDDIMPEALRMPGKTADDCRRALNEMCEEQVKLAALGRHYARQNGIEYTREESIARIQAYLPQTGLENTAAVNENMLISDIIQRYTEYFQKTISEYYEDKIQVVLQ